MSTRLIAVTKGSGELEGKSAQDIISYVARVSNPSNQDNFDTAGKLIKYCITNKHWSVFESVSATIEIKTSRAIAAQILRHRSFTFQEFSQRYSEVTNFVLYEPRRQDNKNRQNSIDDLSPEDTDWFLNAAIGVNTTALVLYEEAIRRGIAKECARFLLPQSTETTIYMTGSLRSWIHYISLRSSNGTQAEHADIAKDCKDIITSEFPDVAKALEW